MFGRKARRDRKSVSGVLLMSQFCCRRSMSSDSKQSHKTRSWRQSSILFAITARTFKSQPQTGGWNDKRFADWRLAWLWLCILVRLSVKFLEDLAGEAWTSFHVHLRKNSFSKQQKFLEKAIHAAHSTISLISEVHEALNHVLIF